MSLKAHLRPDVRVAAVERDLVILDIGGDTYLCLPDGAQAWSDLMCGLESPGVAALVGALLEGGLAEAGDAKPCEGLPPALPSTCLLDGPVGPVRWRDWVALVGAYLDLRMRYEKRSFAEILSFVRSRTPTEGSGVCHEELGRLCRAFERLVVWLPASGKCLVRSFLLLRFLQRSGADATWVFGVETWPFEAHCWLQAGDAVLDDRPERVAAYAPIHAV